MLVPKCGEEEEPVIFDEKPEVEPNNVVNRGGQALCQGLLPLQQQVGHCPKVVHEEVSKLKAVPYRSGKQAQFQHMAVAFAKSGWTHTLFKSIDKLNMHRSQQNKAKAYPRQAIGDQLRWRRGR